MKRFLCVSLVSLVGLAAFASPAYGPGHIRRPPPPNPLDSSGLALNFLLDAPKAAPAREMKLWATYYHMPTIEASDTGASGTPLLGKNGKAISPALSVHDWCDAAMQGSIRISNPGGEPTGYMFVDADGPEQLNCDSRFGDLSDGIKAATRHARFVAFHHPKACDVRAIPLMAFRTIAVDPDRIPMGTVLYVPSLRGQGFWMDGQLYAHDGYVVASDRGGAIRDNHIDMFVSDAASAPFPEVVSSSPRDTFRAFVVPPNDPAAVALKQSQEETCRDVPGPGRSRHHAPPRPKRI
jgi:3D (Asp-Asp-Asp) domain-containing protein